jgi:catalase
MDYPISHRRKSYTAKKKKKVNQQRLIQSSISEVKYSKKSQRAIAKENGIPKSTLNRKINGTYKFEFPNEEEEDLILEFIKECQQGHPLSLTEIGDLMESFIKVKLIIF